MTGRLRASARRPLTDAGRQRAFAAAAAVLVAAAAGLSALATPPAPPATTTEAAEPTPASAAPDVAPADAGGPARPERLPRPVAVVARRFLVGYLARLYGHRDPPPLAGATRRLRVRLSLPARVAPAMRQRRPRVVEVDGQPLSGGRWLVVATVVDGQAASFPVAVVVADRAGGPAVVRVVED